jgi:hypothetical protein
LFAALKDFEGFLTEGVFARSVAHFGDFCLVGCQFGVQGC